MMANTSADITKKISLEIFDLLESAANLAYTRNYSVCTIYHLIEVLFKNSMVQQLMSQREVSFKRIQEEIESLPKNNESPVSIPKGRVVFSPDIKVCLYRAYLIASKMNMHIVSIEDLLLGCLYNHEIEPILNKLSFNLEALYNVILSIRGGEPQKLSSSASILGKFSIDILAKAKSRDLSKIVDREKELGQLIRILVGKGKSNAVLLGEVGVGRSSLIHLLAQKVVSGEIIPQLSDIKIYELNLSALLSAMATRNISELGESLQEEILQLGKSIIFIQNFGSLSDEQSIEKTFVSNILKSIMTTTSCHFVITITSAGYRKLAAKDAELLERFSVIKIEEPSTELAIKILESIAEKLKSFHKINISQEVIESCVLLSKRYLQDKFLPSKAIDLLDEVSSKVVLEKRQDVTIDDVKVVVAERTGIPIERLTVSEQKKLVNLEDILNSTVIGQKEAVHVVSEVIRRSRAGLKDPKKPIGSFLFLGPSGVGKTYLAKNLARIVYDNENAMVRLDMSEFSESHTVQRLIGSPPGYVGYEEGGQLTNPIWEKPYSLILLDEIEKAHPKVFDIFLQVLDEGRLTDGQGRTVDFKNTIIIATSNIASVEILDKLTKEKQALTGFDREQFYDQEILPLLREHFRPEFINRFDEIVVFNPLNIDTLKIIAKLQIEKIQERLKEKKITIQIDHNRLDQFAQKAYNPAFGARPLIRLIQEKVENVIAKKIISGEIQEGNTVKF